MSKDRLERAVLTSAHLVVGAARTTDSCREARQAHTLGPLATVALGRLLTATALAGFAHEDRGDLSVQILGEGRLGRMFADVTPAGHLRGFIKNPRLTMPALPGEREDGRRALAHLVGGGTVSVIRTPGDEGFTQSSTELVTGEIDTDVAAFLRQSDQVPTALAADVLTGADGTVERAGGIIVQAMPGADLERLRGLEERLADGGWHDLLRARGDFDPADLISELVPEARVVGPAQPLAWRCRCSHERVVGALRMLTVVDLAEMVQAGEGAHVRCDFCSKEYTVSPEEVAAAYGAMVAAKD